jgi:hypothetical protein
MNKKWLYNPGSKDAIDEGCLCPILDNYYGLGHLRDGEKYGWVINLDCPMHGDIFKEEKEDV